MRSTDTDNIEKMWRYKLSVFLWAIFQMLTQRQQEYYVSYAREIARLLSNIDLDLAQYIYHNFSEPARWRRIFDISIKWNIT